MFQIPDFQDIAPERLVKLDYLFPKQNGLAFRRLLNGPEEEQFQELLQNTITDLYSHNKSLQSFEADLFKDLHGLLDLSSVGILEIDGNTGSVFDANISLCDMFGYSSREFVGHDLEGIIHPVSLDIFREFIQPAAMDLVFSGLVTSIHKNGSIFFVEFLGTYIFIGEMIYLFVFMSKAENEIEATKIIFDWFWEQSCEKSKLAEIIQTLSSNIEVDPDTTLAQIKQIIPYSFGVLLGLDNDIFFSLAFNGHEYPPVIDQYRETEGFKDLFNGGRPVIFGNIESNDFQTKVLKKILNVFAPVSVEEMCSWLCIPLVIHNNLIGCIILAKEESNNFNFHHARLATIIGYQVAILMNNSGIYKKEQMTGAMLERQNLAHNLHDTVNQSLFSAGLIAEVLPHLWDQNPVEGKRSLSDMYRLIRGAQAEIRMMLVDLRPESLLDVEFCDLLNLLAKAFKGRTNIPIEVSISGNCRLPVEVQTACYHICQEALNNIAKHSKANKAKIIVQLNMGRIEIWIIDDGQGFDRRRYGAVRTKEPFDTSIRDESHGFNPKYIPFNHYGLRMIHEQADSIGADLKIVSQPGNGTQISVQWSDKSMPVGN
jgi:two-component system nitrate/nitrite sensor histidine kinase NarX